MRGKPENPLLIRDDVEPGSAKRKLAGECDWLFLDTAPAMMDQVELAVEAADFVLIPVLASAFDLMAARAVLALCGDHDKPFAFVLNRELLTLSTRFPHCITSHLPPRPPRCDARGRAGAWHSQSARTYPCAC
jgi:MinD superfamily P-loop ATPase